VKYYLWPDIHEEALPKSNACSIYWLMQMPLVEEGWSYLSVKYLSDRLIPREVIMKLKASFSVSCLERRVKMLGRGRGREGLLISRNACKWNLHSDRAQRGNATMTVLHWAYAVEKLWPLPSPGLISWLCCYFTPCLGLCGEWRSVCAERLLYEEKIWLKSPF